MAGKKEKLEYIAEPLRRLAVPIGELSEDPNNARSHGEESIRGIAASLKRFGQRKPIVALSGEKRVLAGNGTLAAARRIGWQFLAVVYVKFDHYSALGYALADNRSAELAQWNEKVIAELLAECMPDFLEDFALQGFLAKAEKALPADRFQVVIECASEEDQKALYKKLRRRKLECKLVLV